jgi:hypothetical protein
MRCVPLWSPDRIWSPRRNPIGHGICPMYPMGVDPTLRVGYTPNARLCPKPCSHYVFTPTPLWTRMSPESQRPPEDSHPMAHPMVHGEAWRIRPCSNSRPSCRSRPPKPASRRPPKPHSLCPGSRRSSGTRVLVDPRVEVVLPSAMGTSLQPCTSRSTAVLWRTTLN